MPAQRNPRYHPAETSEHSAQDPVSEHPAQDSALEHPARDPISEHSAQDSEGLAPPHPAPTVRSRAGAAWVGICIGALVLIALVVFMLQNAAPVEVAFLGMRGSAPLALMLLIAGIGVGIVALVIGSLRIGQLRRRIREDRSSAAQVPRAVP